MQVTPPATRVGKRVVDEDALARPHARDKQVAVAAALEEVSLEALFENEVAIAAAGSSRLMFHAGIDDRHELDSLPAEFFRECFWIREALRIKREDAVAEHVIDVEMNDVEREIAFAILAHDFLDHRVGIVTPAALLVAQRPHRRQRHTASQIGIAAEDLFDRWSIEEVVVHFPALGAEPRALLRRAAEVKIAAVTVVEKDAVGGTALQTDVERDRLIDRIFAFGVTGRVGIPVDEVTAAFV